MLEKKLLQSKTVWFSILAALPQIIEVAQAVAAEASVAKGAVLTIAASAAAIWGRIKAVAKIR